MKVGKWRIEFKTTITVMYKNIKDVPYWRVYIVRRELKHITNKDTGEVLYSYKGMVFYHRAVLSMTYDEVIDSFKDLAKLYVRGIELTPDKGFYVVAYPRKSCKTRV